MYLTNPKCGGHAFLAFIIGLGQLIFTTITSSAPKDPDERVPVEIKCPGRTGILRYLSKNIKGESEDLIVKYEGGQVVMVSIDELVGLDNNLPPLTIDFRTEKNPAAISLGKKIARRGEKIRAKYCIGDKLISGKNAIIKNNRSFFAK